MTKKSIKNIFEINSINLAFKNKETIFTNLKKYIKSDSKLLIAVSWWSDSIVLSIILRNFFLINKFNTNNLYFIHLNHKTRSNNSKDENFIKDFFKWTNLFIKTRTNNLKKTENNLRNRRYQEIKKIAHKNNIDFILFGHNLTDRIESSFMNMLRWCGIQWFQSMLMLQNHHLLDKKVLRPLIDLTKNEITQISKKYKIPHIQDETNKDPKTSLRNLIRIKVLPQIFKLSNKKDLLTNSFVQSFQNIYSQLDEKESNAVRLKEIIKSPYRNCRFGYELDIFKKIITQEQLVAVIKQLGIYKNMSSSFINELHFFIVNKDNRYKYFNQTYFRVSHGKIYIIWAPQNFWTKTIDKKVSINSIWRISLGKIHVAIENKKMIGATLRFPLAWDTFRNKTRNQYCINQKIPIFWRNFLPVVEKNWKIIDNFKSIYIL